MDGMGICAVSISIIIILLTKVEKMKNLTSSDIGDNRWFTNDIINFGYFPEKHIIYRKKHMIYMIFLIL